jgi:fumarate hydratase class II
VAKLALAKDMSVRDAAVQLGTVTKEQLDEIFDVTAMTEPKSAVKKPVGA